MSAAASPIRSVAAMTGAELRLVLRRPENLFATIVIPTLVLVLFSSLSILPTGTTGRPVEFLLPGSIALGLTAVMRPDEIRYPEPHVTVCRSQRRSVCWKSRSAVSRSSPMGISSRLVLS